MDPEREGEFNLSHLHPPGAPHDREFNKAQSIAGSLAVLLRNVRPDYIQDDVFAIPNYRIALADFADRITDFEIQSRLPGGGSHEEIADARRSVVRKITGKEEAIPEHLRSRIRTSMQIINAKLVSLGYEELNTYYLNERINDRCERVAFVHQGFLLTTLLALDGIFTRTKLDPQVPILELLHRRSNLSEILATDPTLFPVCHAAVTLRDFDSDLGSLQQQCVDFLDHIINYISLEIGNDEPRVDLRPLAYTPTIQETIWGFRPYRKGL